MKVLLIYPEIESSNTNTSTYSLPLGLGSIATYCKNAMEGFGDSLDVKILDGSMISHEEQLVVTTQYKPDLTGINSTIASQKNAYEIGKLAKAIGSKVVFGGVHSTKLWRNMLKNRDFIDGVILYDGEISTFLILNRLKETKLLENNSFIGIPNLAYRDSEGNIHEPSSIYIPALSELPNIDYSLFNMGRFLEQTQKKGFGKAVSYNNINKSP